MRKTLSMMVVALLAVLFAFNANATEVWVQNDVSVSLTEKTSLDIGQEIKFSETDFNDTIEHAYSVGVTRNLPHNFYVGGFYEYKQEDDSSGLLKEHRFFAQVGHRLTLVENRLYLPTRFRGELRTFEQDMSEEELRLRFRLGLEAVTNVGSTDVTTFVDAEAFHSDLEDNSIYRVRYRVGLSIAATEHIDVLVGYLREDNRNGSDDKDVIFAGLGLNF